MKKRLKNYILNFQLKFDILLCMPYVRNKGHNILFCYILKQNQLEIINFLFSPLCIFCINILLLLYFLLLNIFILVFSKNYESESYLNN